MATVLVVEDEVPIQGLFCQAVRLDGHRAVGVGSGEEAVRLARAQAFDLVLLDLKLPGGIDGLETFDVLRTEHPDVRAVIVTGYGTIPSAVKALRAGICDYLEKPIDVRHLKDVVNACLDAPVGARSDPKGAFVRAEGSATEHEFDGMIGACSAMSEVFHLISKFAASDLPVLVTGETGTGKELVARALHRQSPRRDGPFVAVNCAAGQATLFESEFFGHERGAFTDAREAKSGRFEQAHQGTLFLDEIGELPIEVQAKLLRVLENGETTRVGGTRVVRFDVRVIVATNVDLEQAIRRGAFRPDLYYRIAQLAIDLPALRQRREDVSLLLKHFFERAKRVQGKPQAQLSCDAEALLLSYDWPGNVRELQYALRQALLIAPDLTIRVEDLPPSVRRAENSMVTEEELVPPEGVTLGEHISLVTARLERAAIQHALAVAKGNRSKAARILGVDRKTLYEKIVRYRL